MWGCFVYFKEFGAFFEAIFSILGSALGRQEQHFLPTLPKNVSADIKPDPEAFGRSRLPRQKNDLSLMLFFTFLKHFSPSLACRARGTAGASGAAMPNPPNFEGYSSFNRQIPSFDLQASIQGPNLLQKSISGHSTCVPNGIKRGGKARIKVQQCPRCFLEGLFCRSFLRRLLCIFAFINVAAFPTVSRELKVSPEPKLRPLRSGKRRGERRETPI